jgi:hypothetical protein
MCGGFDILLVVLLVEGVIMVEEERMAISSSFIGWVLNYLLIV